MRVREVVLVLLL